MNIEYWTGKKTNIKHNGLKGVGIQRDIKWPHLIVVVYNGLQLQIVEP